MENIASTKKRKNAKPSSSALTNWENQSQERLERLNSSGSGTTGVAAVALNRKYIGIEKEDEFLELSIKRFMELKNGSS